MTIAHFAPSDRPRSTRDLGASHSLTIAALSRAAVCFVRSMALDKELQAARLLEYHTSLHSAASCERSSRERRASEATSHACVGNETTSRAEAMPRQRHELPNRPLSQSSVSSHAACRHSSEAMSDARDGNDETAYRVSRPCQSDSHEPPSRPFDGAASSPTRCAASAAKQ
jgi:hypothetical protein